MKITPHTQLYVDESIAGRNDIVKFVFVGKDSIRKGVREIVEVMTEIRKTRKDFELYLILHLDNYKDYVFRSYDDSKEEMDELKMKIDTAKDWIHFYDRLPNEKVMEIVKQCDVGLLPTWHDTYGYSVLEFQSCGLPVLSTDCRALPEINKHGWRISLSTNRIDSFKEKNRQRMLLQKEIHDIVIHILDHHEEIRARGCKSLDYIKACHNPDDYAEKIKLIYNTFIE